MIITKKIRLLYYSPTVGSTGKAGSQRTLEFAEALSRNGFYVFLASPYLKEFASNADLTLIPLPKNPLLIVKSLKKIAIQNHIDVILERLEGGNLVVNGHGALVARLLKIPFVSEIHVPPYSLRSRFTSFFWLRFSIKNSSKIFIVSSNVAKMLSLHVKPKDKRLIAFPNGYDQSKIRNSSVTKTELSMPTDKIIISYFGELSEDKGVSVIFSILNNKELKNQFYFIIGGWGPFEQSFKEIAADQPQNIRYLGIVSKTEVFNYLKISDFSLALYKKTQFGGMFFGQPLKVYESLFCGTNVLITSRMNLPEEIFKLCILVEPSLADIVQITKSRFKKNDLKRQEEFQKTVSQYSWDSIISRVFYPEFLNLMIKNKLNK